MMHRRVMFGRVVSFVGWSWGPIEPKLSLCFAASKPVEAHVHGLGSLGDDRLVGDSHGSRVVDLDRSFGLWPAHFGEGLAKGDHIFGGEEEGS